MKKIIGLVLLASLVSTQGFAERNRRVAEVDDGNLWFGVSTDTLLTRGTTTPSASLLIQLGNQFFLQTNFNIQTTTPFNFGVGAIAKFGVSGNNTRGLHLNAGFGLGTTGAAETFFGNIVAGAGLHAQIMQGLMLSADTGLSVGFGGGTNVALGGLSGLLGLSLHVRI